MNAKEVTFNLLFNHKNKYKQKTIKTMKKFFILAALVAALTSCVSPRSVNVEEVPAVIYTSNRSAAFVTATCRLQQHNAKWGNRPDNIDIYVDGERLPRK